MCCRSMMANHYVAFGLMARLLDPARFSQLAGGVHGMEAADSITGDAHKLLNVPYDCGIFFSRHPDIAVEVFENPGAAYLASSGDDTDAIISPSNVGIENSRRFRALPLYASLRTYGREGYREMLERQISTARRIARWIRLSADYVLLPASLNEAETEEALERIFIIVLFKANDAGLNENLVSLINATGEIYVSGTVWEGTKATRIAVANWRVDTERECSTVMRVLSTIAQMN
jgi:glutamate/tyrosine decarboxylase-like PLP-dependent enzyme